MWSFIVLSNPTDAKEMHELGRTREILRSFHARLVHFQMKSGVFALFRLNIFCLSFSIYEVLLQP